MPDRRHGTGRSDGRFRRVGTAPWTAALLGLLGALLFVALSSVNLQRQGAYQDELHQAVASFQYAGSDQEMGIALSVIGIPLLNMTYSGAIKSGLYGAYLALFGAEFSLLSWRLLGILFTGTGLLLFAWLTRSVLSRSALVVFLVLMLTDGSVLLASRHDWGPVALGLLLRLAFVGVWIRGLCRHSQEARHRGLALGFLLGLAVYEKLSSVVLLAPLTIFLLADARRPGLRMAKAAAIGLALGSIPLLFVNIVSLIKRGDLASLSGVAEPIDRSLEHFGTFLSYYFSMGTGQFVEGLILGASQGLDLQVEQASLISSLLLITVSAWIMRRESTVLRFGGVAVLGYASVGLATYLLPRSTWAHHWILGTPLQYAAIALATTGFLHLTRAASVSVRIMRVLLTIVLMVWLPLRVQDLWTMERALERGESSLSFTPELNTIGRFAREHRDEIFFAAASWGVAFTIYAFSNGHDDLVEELFWDYRGLETIDRVLRRTNKSEIYVVSVNSPGLPSNLNRADVIETDFDAHRNLRAIALPKELQGLEVIRLRRYVSGPAQQPR